MTKLRPATRKDAHFLSTRLREEDIQELYASSGMSPLEALLQGLSLSKPHAWALGDSGTGEPYLMGGVRPAGNGIGIVWLLGSPEIEKHALTFQREAKNMILRIWEGNEYRALCNVVSADNRKAIEWLSRLGFTFVHRDCPVGRHGELFHSFVITGEA